MTSISSSALSIIGNSSQAEKKTLKNGLNAVETVFGLTVHGPTSESTTAVLCSKTIVLESHATPAESFLEWFWDPESFLEWFWDLDTIGIRSEVCEQPHDEATLTQLTTPYGKSMVGPKYDFPGSCQPIWTTTKRTLNGDCLQLFQDFDKIATS